MSEKTQVMEEYKMLRSELMYFMNKDMSLLTCLYSAVTATLFFSLQWKMPEGCLLAFLIIIPICNKFIYHQKQMAKISAYMSCFLETELDIKWETRVGRIKGLRNGNPKQQQKIRGGSSLKFTDSLMMALGAIFCYFFILWQQLRKNGGFRPKSMLVAETICVIIFLIIVCFMSRKTYQIQKYREKYLRQWKEISEKEGDYYDDGNGKN